MAPNTTVVPLRRALCAWLLWLVCAAASAAPATAPLASRLADIIELNRYVPERALPQLLQIEPEARSAGLPLFGDFLTQLCVSYQKLGDYARASAACDELTAIGRARRDNVALAKGMLHTAYIAFAKGELTESHRLIWDSEKLARGTGDIELRVRAMISSGEAHAEDGDFLLAITRVQEAAQLARLQGTPVHQVMALNSLASLYGQVRDYDKGFETLAEAASAAEQTHSPGRMATLKKTEYGLAIDSGQIPRALAALHAALDLSRQIGAHEMIATTLVNLSDCYLKQDDYTHAIDYANQAIRAARALNNEALVATARMNLGEGYLGKGRLAEGKRQLAEGLAWYERAGAKPDLQRALAEYGEALENVGDMAGAVKAYHRERALSDELFEKRRQSAIVDLQQRYETDKQQRQIELLRRDNQLKSADIDNRRLQQRVWWLLALVFALSSVMIGLLYRKVRQANARLALNNETLREQSARDPLTGLYNRRHFQDYMLGQPSRQPPGASDDLVGALFLLDVDHFKHINDTYGHAAGDAVLKSIAAGLNEILRETDMIVRWGGEEFLAYLPSLPRSGLDDVARRIMNGLGGRVVHYQEQALAASVSIGFIAYPFAHGGEALSWEHAVNLADKALYLAKTHGRRRAFGVRGLREGVALSQIEYNLDSAWRAGLADLSVVLMQEDTTLLQATA